MHYRQVQICSNPFRREDWAERQVCWLPESLARVGKMVFFDRDEGKLWEVEEVYAPRVPEDYIKEYAKDDYRKQREASDI